MGRCDTWGVANAWSVATRGAVGAERCDTWGDRTTGAKVAYLYINDPEGQQRGPLRNIIFRKHSVRVRKHDGLCMTHVEHTDRVVVTNIANMEHH